MLKKSINIFTLSTSLLIFWNSSVLSNTPNNSTDFTDNHVYFANQKVDYQNKNPNPRIAQGIANNINITGSWTGKLICGETKFPVSVIFRQVPRDANNINILADIGPNPSTGKDIKTFKGAFDPKTLNMTLATLLGNQIWAIAGHFDSKLQNFITDRAVPCSLTLNSSNSKPKTTPPSIIKPTNNSKPKTTPPSIRKPTKPPKDPVSSPSVKPPELVTINQIDLTGNWIGEGYGCEKNGLIEEIQINVIENELVAKKITGDNCVPAGNTTFQGKLPNSLFEGSSFPVTWTIGTPNNPAGSKTEQNLTILNVNSFSSYGVKFTRVTKQVNSPSNGSLTATPSVNRTRKPNSQSVRPTNLQSDVSLTGKWKSDWGDVVFNPDLTGYWNQNSGVGKIKDGTYDRKTRKLIFHYYQSWNDMNGTATLTLSEDGNQLAGSWSQQRGSNPPGSGGSGGWTMTRDPSQ